MHGQDASRLLRGLGYAHVNEADVGYGYVADVYLPTVCTKSTPRGSVLELDGPFHFDNYSFASLGPTVLKRRHLSNMGYGVISLPFWEYHISMSTVEKERALLRSIEKVHSAE